MANTEDNKAQENTEVEFGDLSERQQKAIFNWKTGLNWHDALVKAGYSEAYAHNPHQFRRQSLVKEFFRNASSRVRERLAGDILFKAEQRLAKELNKEESDSAAISLIKLVLKYAGLEPATKQKIEQTVTQEDGGSELDLSVLYEVLDPEDAEKALRALQEDDG